MNPRFETLRREPGFLALFGISRRRLVGRHRLIIEEGGVFERAGVGFSRVQGPKLPPSASASRPDGSSGWTSRRRCSSCASCCAGSAGEARDEAARAGFTGAGRAVACRGVGAPLHPGVPGHRPDRGRHLLHDRRAAVSRPPCARSGDADSLRDPVRLGIGRLLDRDDGLPAAADRPGPLFDQYLAGAGHEDSGRGEDRDPDADLQREHRPRVRRPARHLRLGDAQRSGPRLRLLHPQRHLGPGHPGRRTRSLAAAVPRRRRLRPHPLPPSPSPDQAQERQHRRLLPPLGLGLQVHGDPRRRLGDERRLPGPSRPADGSQSKIGRASSSSRARRAPPVATPCIRASSSSRPASTARCSPPACTSGSSAKAITGATTRSSASPRSWLTARCRDCPAAGRCPAKSCRTTSSKRP